MKATAFYRFWWVGALVGTILCVGCFGKSQSSRFYALSAMAHTAAGSLSDSPARDAAIGIGPIKIADYLDRSKIPAPATTASNWPNTTNGPVLSKTT